MWQTKWRVINAAASRRGGQGSIIRVRCRTDDRVTGALKELHIDHLRSTERRFRVQQEANALIALNGFGVPKLLDSNVELWANEAVPLYVVMEWVDGPTLQEMFSKTVATIDEALAVIDVILKTVEEFHRLEIHHRDLKPDNIILENGSVNRPVLVDFGLAWSKPGASKERAHDTPVGQELGNRFLRLPEFAPGQKIHDARSDVTMVVGILFFLIYGVAPRVLEDAHGRLPDEVHAARVPNITREDPRWPRLKRVFRIGLQPRLENRFPNVEAVRSRLADLNPPDIEAEDQMIREELSALNDIMASEGARSAIQAEAAMMTGAEAFMRIFRESLSGTGFVYGGSGPNPIDGGRGVLFQFFVLRSGTTDPKAEFAHTLKLDGPTVHAEVRIEGENWDSYYSGPLSDVDGLVDSMEGRCRRVLVELLRILREKLEEIYE